MLHLGFVSSEVLPHLMILCEVTALPLRVQRYAKFRIIPNHLLSFCTKFTFRLSMCKSWHSNMVLHRLGTFHGIRSWGWPHRCYNYAEGGRRAWSPVRLGDEVCRNGHFAASAALFPLFLCPRRGNAVSLHLKGLPAFRDFLIFGHCHCSK